ncbi:hypothetical protein Q2T40_19485 [Winogradskyella maritima]|uniref:Uncharacterized protein n=1 Tax=Winogradskyella maritima TaxID=1517766 RepID=A0ABV8AEB1_9FLAO|nr:hypothetical protein [Winogradskyella maritima]
MKSKLHLLSVLCVAFIFSCSTEQVEGTPEQNYFRVSEYTVNNSASSRSVNEETPCFTVDLVAGQHMVMGTVSVSMTDEDLVLTYETDADWTIGTTHVSIGDCNEEWVPTTGSGNPKIGKFGHTEPHSADINKVVYLISREVMPESDLFCFASHAEVIGPDGEETAWAGNNGDESDDDSDDGDGNDGGGGVFRQMDLDTEGYNVISFSGRSWAMYIEALQSTCED